MSEIFFFRGYSAEQIRKGRDILTAEGVDPAGMKLVPVDAEMLSANVEQMLIWFDAHDQPPITDAAPGLKAVIMAVESKEKAMTVMRIFKAILDDPSEPAFAMVTETSLSWTLSYYMDHIHQEHEYMKTHNPADDPDMKRVD